MSGATSDKQNVTVKIEDNKDEGIGHPGKRSPETLDNMDVKDNTRTVINPENDVVQNDEGHKQKKMRIE